MSIDQREFIRSYIDTIASQPIALPDDFQTPPEKKPRKAPLVTIDVAELPKSVEAAPSDSKPAQDSITLTVKSLKPALVYHLSNVSLSDPISSLKSQLAAQPDAPPPSHQRLLLKGKALADSKLLKEYDIVDGASLVLMIKAGWIPGGDSSAQSSAASGEIKSEEPPVDPTAKSAIPTLTISTDTSSTAIPLPTTTQPSASAHDLHPAEASFHARLADPAFWQALHTFGLGQFEKEQDAEGFWEGCLLGLKSRMTESEVARARDTTGITGMGGGIGL
ncbi:Ubiquitin domain [Phaffia rhodozyma]|uniref:Ubiquitin domain n=1 Tax=Phaffia rhodozyma TaxID=264483 RepID=A0A0F7SS98_PHARH|nr:Ubiquitin domain [Phaffia rhodozyma]